MKKVLLTGASGFIGQHCLPWLQASDYEVHAISFKTPTTNTRPNVCWHRADLFEAIQVARLMADVKPTHLLHLAWYGEPGKYWTSPENFRWVKASLDLLESFADCGGRRIVMAGTCAEYDWQSGYCSEAKTELAPSTPYGACKHALQVMLGEYARQIRLSAAWGRLFFLYGPHERNERFVASVIRSLLLNEPAFCSHGNQRRDFLYVEDVAAAFVALLSSDVCGPVNIASGKAVALKEIIFEIAEKLNRGDLVQLGAVPVTSGDPPLLVAETKRLQEEVGWAPRYDLNQGLELTIEWWKRSLFNQ